MLALAVVVVGTEPVEVHMDPVKLEALAMCMKSWPGTLVHIY